MKLSEFIRFGAMLKPQGFGLMASYPNSVSTCAIGAALEALIGEARLSSRSTHYEFARNFPWVHLIVAPNPVSGDQEYVSGVIWKLNDIHRWTREQIANWVATVEPQEELNPPSVPIYEETPEEVIA